MVKEALNEQSNLTVSLSYLAQIICAIGAVIYTYVTLTAEITQLENQVALMKDDLKSEVRTNKSAVMFGERLFWVVLTGLIGTLFWIFRT